MLENNFKKGTRKKKYDVFAYGEKTGLGQNCNWIREREVRTVMRDTRPGSKINILTMRKWLD